MDKELESRDDPQFGEQPPSDGRAKGYTRPRGSARAVAFTLTLLLVVSGYATLLSQAKALLQYVERSALACEDDLRSVTKYRIATCGDLTVLGTLLELLPTTRAEGLRLRPRLAAIEAGHAMVHATLVHPNAQKRARAADRLAPMLEPATAPVILGRFGASAEAARLPAGDCLTRLAFAISIGDDARAQALGAECTFESEEYTLAREAKLRIAAPWLCENRPEAAIHLLQRAVSQLTPRDAAGRRGDLAFALLHCSSGERKSPRATSGGHLAWAQTAFDVLERNHPRAGQKAWLLDSIARSRPRDRLALVASSAARLRLSPEEVGAFVSSLADTRTLDGEVCETPSDLLEFDLPASFFSVSPEDWVAASERLSEAASLGPDADVARRGEWLLALTTKQMRSVGVALTAMRGDWDKVSARLPESLAGWRYPEISLVSAALFLSGKPEGVLALWDPVFARPAGFDSSSRGLGRLHRSFAYAAMGDARAAIEETARPDADALARRVEWFSGGCGTGRPTSPALLLQREAIRGQSRAAWARSAGGADALAEERLKPFELGIATPTLTPVPAFPGFRHNKVALFSIVGGAIGNHDLEVFLDAAFPSDGKPDYFWARREAAQARGDLNARAIWDARLQRRVRQLRDERTAVLASL